MVEIKVKCESCGAEYSSGIVVKDSLHITVKGNLAQCPKCGRMNPVDDRHIRIA